MKTKDKIILEAVKLFNEQGLHFVGVRELARALQISPGNLSYHFSRKDDIIVEILKRLRVANNKAYREYQEGAATLERFFVLLRQVFQNQYDFRGITLLSVRQIFKDLSALGFDYDAVQKKRKAFFRNTFQAFIEDGRLKEEREREDIEFLVSVMTLIGRFWLSESQVSFRNWEREKVIDYYLRLLARHFLLFATEKGAREIHAFFNSQYT